MVQPDHQPRPEVLVATLLYLITAYRRSKCPALAACITRHFEYLAAHPTADRVLVDIAVASRAEWESAAIESPVTRSTPSKKSFRMAWH